MYRDFGPEVGDAFSEGLTKVWHRIDIPNPADYLDNRVPNAGLVGLASVNHAFAKGLEISKLTPDDVVGAVQLCIWDHDPREPWFEEVVETYPDHVVAALMPWLEFELCVADEAPILNTVDLALSGPATLKTRFLERAEVFLREGKIIRRSLERRIIRELIDDGLASKDLIRGITLSRLLAFENGESTTFPSEWFADWAMSDFPGAWHWIEENSRVLSDDRARLASLASAALDDTAWGKGMSGTVEETRALVALFRFLTDSMKSGEASPDGVPQRSSTATIRDRIPGILASLKGAPAQEALVTLLAEHSGTPMGDWLLRQADEHASAEAERDSALEPADLAHFGEIYTRDPRSVSELFDQVMARLEEIREGVEGGPFSDRVLFFPTMEGKNFRFGSRPGSMIRPGGVSSPAMRSPGSPRWTQIGVRILRSVPLPVRCVLR